MQLQELVVPLKMDTKSFHPAIAGAIGGVLALVGAVVGAIKLTADWAKDLDELGDIMGGTNEEIAAMAYLARKSGVGVETLAHAQVVLEKGLVKSNGQLDVTGKKLKEYGIKVKDANGNVKTQAQLTDEISKKYQELGTQTEKVNFLTEIFGRNGASLVDLFDTLAAEGGIDAVTQKVKDMGLAIDPARYEQFNRNLQELKLIGLSMAVAFTEKVLPVLERMLNWVIDLAKSPDWATASQKLIDGIKGINWEKLGQTFAENLKITLGGVKWGELFGAILSAAHDFLHGIGVAIQQAWQPAWDQMRLTVSLVWGQIVTTVQAKFEEIKASISAKILEIKAALVEKITLIKKDFFNGFQGAMQQANRAMEGMKQTLLNTLKDIFDALKAIVAKGIVIAITASIPAWLLPFINQKIPSTNQNTGAGGGGGIKHKATGGFGSGLTWVGERGPELVDLPGGSRVFTNAQSSAMTNDEILDALRRIEKASQVDYSKLSRSIRDAILATG